MKQTIEVPDLHGALGGTRGAGTGARSGGTVSSNGSDRSLGSGGRSGLCRDGSSTGELDRDASGGTLSRVWQKRRISEALTRGNEVDSRIERQSRQRPDGQTPVKETAQAGQPQNPMACCERDNGTYGAARSDTTEDGCNDRLVLTDTSGVAEVTAATIIA